MVWSFCLYGWFWCFVLCGRCIVGYGGESGGVLGVVVVFELVYDGVVVVYLESFFG